MQISTLAENKGKHRQDIYPYKKKKVVAPLPRPDSPQEFCEQINNINPKMAVGEGFFLRNACGKTSTQRIHTSLNYDKKKE
ncbi:hypothetical protein [Marinoscillum furvescens]|uniref:hypothetical protein n=1 Tax=Marinoscillum furvescens TaxID=1026 RepID=UPI000E281CA7|nr:hypothetical protein [Marinoscillum furvescens]